jgi:EAL domain-containing protein (putative c-di-GMP-specific phosphodiesterase class I)
VVSRPVNFVLRVLGRLLDTPQAQRVKEALFDPVTALPTFAVLLPHIREILAQGKGVGLLTVNITPFAKLEEVYGWESFDEVVRGVAGCIRAVKDAALRKEDTLAELTVNGNVFVLILSPPRRRRRMGERDVTRIKQRLSRRLDAYLRTAFSADVLRRFACFVGGAVMRPDPSLRVERLVYRTIDEALADGASEEKKVARQRIRQLKAILEGKRITTLYQPIMDLDAGAVLGYEALSRGPAGSLQSPAILFQTAYDADLVMQLERLCRQRALRRVSGLTSKQLLFLNLESACVFDPELTAPRFVRRFAKRIVFEITERAAITDFAAFRQAVQLLRRFGYLVALDDVGSAYAGLRVISEIRPDFIKLDMQLIRGADGDQVKRQLIGAVAGFCGKAEVPLIVEGVETRGELEVVRTLGVRRAQGLLFGPLLKAPSAERRAARTTRASVRAAGR